MSALAGKLAKGLAGSGKVPNPLKVLEPTVAPQKLGAINKATAIQKQKLGQEKFKTKTQFEKLQEVQDTPDITTMPEDIPALDDINTQQQLDLAQKRAEVQRNISLRINKLEAEKRATEIAGRGAEKGETIYDTMYNMISKKAGAGETFSNIEARATAIYTRVSASMTGVKSNLRTKWAGLAQDTQSANDLIRYLKDGTASSPEVKAMGEEWKKAANQIKALRNKAGSKIGELEDWVLPQSHDKFSLRKAGLEEWKKRIRPLIDADRMEKQVGNNIEDILDHAYKSITSAEVKNSSFSANMAKRHEEQRVIHFKDGDSIIKYNEQFGNSDVFGTMDNHVRSQSQEIAAMQLFGANPDELYGKMKEMAGDKLGTFEKNKLDALWNVVLGEADGDNIIDVTDKVIAGIGGGHRSIQTASKLGSASISAIADLGNIVLGAAYRGDFFSSIKIMGTGLNTLAQEALGGTTLGRNTDFASRLGIVSEFASASLANSRYAEASGTGALSQTSEAVLRGSGLGAWTNSLRAGFGLELNSRMFQDFGTKFDDLNYSDMLTEYGISTKDWDTIRGTKGRTLKSDSFEADFLDMEAVYKADEELGYKLSELISTEMDAFVITPTARTRVYTTFGKKKGTLLGETARNLMLFKSFPISIVQMHMARLSKMTGMGKIGYTAGAVTSSIAFGGLALMAYDTVTGKTTRSVDRPEFFYEALTKGGGLGIFGDLFSGMEQSRYGNSWYSTALGVPFSTMEDITGILGDIKAEAYGDDPNVMANAYNRAKKYIPGQNMWYTRTLFSETLGDFMQQNIDPKYYSKEQRRMKYMKQRDQDYLFR